jgi:hypothetical protein
MIACSLQSASPNPLVEERRVNRYGHVEVDAGREDTQSSAGAQSKHERSTEYIMKVEKNTNTFAATAQLPQSGRQCSGIECVNQCNSCAHDDVNRNITDPTQELKYERYSNVDCIPGF